MWAKIDDGFPSHPKVLSAGIFAELVQVRAICYSSRYMTDGFISRNVVTSLLHGLSEYGVTSESVTALLERYGMWEPREGGWYIHNFLKFNPSKQRQINERTKAAERVKRWRESHVTPLLTVPPSSSSSSSSSPEDTRADAASRYTQQAAAEAMSDSAGEPPGAGGDGVVGGEVGGKKNGGADDGVGTPGAGTPVGLGYRATTTTAEIPSKPPATDDWVAAQAKLTAKRAEYRAKRKSADLGNWKPVIS